MVRPLPESIRIFLDLLVNGNYANRCVNPGLYLDKLADSYLTNHGGFQEKVQLPTLEELVKINSQTGNQQAQLMNALLDRQLVLWKKNDTRVIKATAVSPVVLHLARASSLENGSVCLHPVYGFAYVPGSGLKGLAQAYAVEWWLPSQEDYEASLQKIKNVFGFAPSVMLSKRYESIGRRLGRNVMGGNSQEAQEGSACVGEVVFHDALPTFWPKLFIDILNNHHREYYQSANDQSPPGDWENPIPVYFPAIQRGTQFGFAIMARRTGGDDESLKLATEWLAGGITQLGVGGKTSSGYGVFKIDSVTSGGDLNGNSDSTEKVAASIKSVRESDRLLQKEFSCKLKLVTPAFFAGADQTDKEGCDLRPATLRGQLRWWWRTMHAAHVSSKTLLDLENVIWGDTKNSGCVQVSLTREGEIVFEGLDRRISDNHRVIENPEFFRHYRIDRPQGQGTPGLFYASYGMEISRNGRTQRYIAKGGSWQVHFKIRPNVQSNPRMESSDIVNQVKYSLWLLTQFGGVGAKSRRGFGSLALDVNAGFNGLTLDKIREESRIFREKCSLVRHDAGTGTAALESARFIEGLLPENVPSENAWQVMNYIGTILRDFSQSATNSRHGKHCKEKVALGLPRKIHGPEKNRMNHQTVHTRPVELKGQKGNRHASPLIFHVASSGNNPGKFVIRSTIFPNNYLWSTVAGEGTNIEDSKSYWNKLEAYLKGKLITPPAGEIPTAINPQPGDRVRVKLKSYIPRTGQWQIISLDEGNKPGLLDSLNAPQDLHLKPGMEVEVLVSNRRSFYQWP